MEEGEIFEEPIPKPKFVEMAEYLRVSQANIELHMQIATLESELEAVTLQLQEYEKRAALQVSTDGKFITAKELHEKYKKDKEIRDHNMVNYEDFNKKTDSPDYSLVKAIYHETSPPKRFKPADGEPRLTYQSKVNYTDRLINGLPDVYTRDENGKIALREHNWRKTSMEGYRSPLTADPIQPCCQNPRSQCKCYDVFGKVESETQEYKAAAKFF